MSKNNIVNVGKSDELASVIDKIVTSDSRAVFLVLSDDSYIAQNILNLRLIKRESENVGKEVIVVSENPRIQNLALKASLKLKERLEENVATSPVSKSGHYTREVTDILPPSRSLNELNSGATDLRRTRSTEVSATETEEEKLDEQKVEIRHDKVIPTEKVKKEELLVKTYESAAIVEEEKKGKSKKKTFSFNFSFSKLDKFKKFLSPPFFKKSIYILSVIAAMSLVLSLIYLAINVLPRVTIVLNPYSVEDEINFAVVADSNISSAEYAKSIIPAQILEERKEETFTYKATGSAQLEEFAVGTVRIFNEFSSSTQTLVANTRLMSSEGKLFRTTETVVIPGAKIEGGKIIANSIEIGIRADEAGQDYNMEPTTFSIPGFKGDPKFLAFYGKSEESMVGGYRGVAVVPTEEDIENAKRKINDEYLPILEQNLRNKVPENLILLEESLDARVESLEIDANVGEPKEEFSVKFIGVAQVFLVREEDVSNAIAYYFINSTKYSKDFELSEEKNIEYIVKEADYEKGFTEFNLKTTQRFNRIVDTSSVLEEVKGKNDVEVRRILSANEALELAQVKFWPFWVKTVPNDSESISIEVEYIIK